MEATIFVTFVNGDEKYRKLMINWALHLRALRMLHVVIAFDDEAAQTCHENGIPHLRYYFRKGIACMFGRPRLLPQQQARLLCSSNNTPKETSRKGLQLGLGNFGGGIHTHRPLLGKLFENNFEKQSTNH